MEKEIIFVDNIYEILIEEQNIYKNKFISDKHINTDKNSLTQIENFLIKKFMIDLFLNISISIDKKSIDKKSIKYNNNLKLMELERFYAWFFFYKYGKNIYKSSSLENKNELLKDIKDSKDLINSIVISRKIDTKEIDIKINNDNNDLLLLLFCIISFIFYVIFLEN